MPAAVVLLRDRRSIAEVSGRFASVFGRPVVDLLGSDLLRFVDPGDASLVGSVIHESRSMAAGSVPSSVVGRFVQPDGSRRLVEVSAAHRPDGSSRGSTVVLLRPQTLRHGVNAALIPHVGWQDADAPISSMEMADTALDTIAGILACEPVAHDCYFLKPEESTGRPQYHPESLEMVDVPIAGPWDEVLAGRTAFANLEVTALPAALQQFARRRHYTALRCLPVRASHGEGVVACLVAWDRREGPLHETAEPTLRYAVEIASLAIGRAKVADTVARPPTGSPVPRAEPWPADVDVVTGLPLEPTLVRSLDEMISSGARPGLICVRLDSLPTLRNSLGEFTTDQLIRVSARRVNSLVRMTDEVYRTGEDGLAIICTGVPDSDRLVEISRRLKDRLGVPFRFEAESPVHVRASVASLEAPDPPLKAVELLAAVQGLMI
jgi:GGDEF domain-containing protein